MASPTIVHSRQRPAQPVSVYGNEQANDDDISPLDYESDYAPYHVSEYSPSALSDNSISRVVSQAGQLYDQNATLFTTTRPLTRLKGSEARAHTDMRGLYGSESNERLGKSRSNLSNVTHGKRL